MNRLTGFATFCNNVSILRLHFIIARQKADLLNIISIIIYTKCICILIVIDTATYLVGRFCSSLGALSARQQATTDEVTWANTCIWRQLKQLIRRDHELNK